MLLKTAQRAKVIRKDFEPLPKVHTSRSRVRTLQSSFFFQSFELLAVLCVLGLTQLTGHDFFESSAGLQLIVPERLSYYMDKLEFGFAFFTYWNGFSFTYEK